MSEEYSVVLPKLGESIVSAVIVQWFKKEGDVVALDEPLLEVSTDKVNSEIPSPIAGRIKKILASPDEEKDVGEVLAILEAGEERSKDHVTMREVSLDAEQECNRENFSNRDCLSPSVLRIAQEKGISVEMLQNIQGTGEGGRVTKKDVERLVLSKEPSPCVLSAKAAQGSVEKMKITGMRKAIADNMVRSFYEAPHATLIQEIDVTSIMKCIEKQKDAFFAKEGAKLTITSFILKVLGEVLPKFPLLNASVEQDTILLKKQVNIGVAVSVDQGLIVPVVKGCHALSLAAIAHAVQDLSGKARSGKLAPSDVLDGTITVTNFGMSGVMLGVPIIRYPEVAIIGIGAIKKSVQVMENDMLAIRSLLHMSLTFDHRIIDGMYGCAFLRAVQDVLTEDLLLR